MNIETVRNSKHLGFVFGHFGRSYVSLLLSMPCWLLIPLLPATGQPLFTTAETLDWMIADSDVIIRGTIEAFERTRTKRRVAWDTVTVNVDETLKGCQEDSRVFTFRNQIYLDAIEQWREGSQEVLVFLVVSDRLELMGSNPDQKRVGRYPLTPRFISVGRQAIIPLSGEEKDGVTPIHTIDLNSLSSSSEILEYTREGIRATDERSVPTSHTVRWPKLGAEIVDRLVPISAKLEGEAIKWVHEKDPLLREVGAKALQHFPSAENVSILKQLLHDPAYSTVSERYGQMDVELARDYYVRQAALASLQKLEELGADTVSK